MRHAKHLESRPPVGRGGRAPAILVRVDDRLVVLVVRVHPLARHQGRIRHGIAHGDRAWGRTWRHAWDCAMHHAWDRAWHHAAPHGASHGASRGVDRAVYVQCTCSAQLVHGALQSARHGASHGRAHGTMGSKLFQQSQWSGCLRAAGIAQALQVVRAQQQRRLAALDSRGATVNQRGTLPKAWRVARSVAGPRRSCGVPSGAGR